MNTKELEKRLDKAIDDFSDASRTLKLNSTDHIATMDDIEEVSRQTVYLASEFKKEIINYLSKN